MFKFLFGSVASVLFCLYLSTIITIGAGIVEKIAPQMTDRHAQIELAVNPLTKYNG